MSTGDSYQLIGAFALSELPTIHELAFVVISYARRLWYAHRSEYKIGDAFHLLATRAACSLDGETPHNS